MTPFELFGVECGKGWYPLVKKAIAAVARYNGINKCDPLYGPVEFTQIKEKFGYLNLYLNYYPVSLEEELKAIEEESTHICERCGNPGEIKEIHGWNMCLCDKCAEDEINRFNNLRNESLAK